MRVLPACLTLLAVACHGALRRDQSPTLTRAVTWDSATARRLCQAPDSVLAGKKDCVLLDQSRRRDIRPTERRAP